METAEAIERKLPDAWTTMQAATAFTLPQDRNCSWYDEVQRILPDLASLPANAQCAVRTVIASIAEEVNQEVEPLLTP